MLTHSRLLRRRSVVLLASLGLLTPALAAIAPAANAGQLPNKIQLSVIGTSDISDSNLVANVIKPGFEGKYQNYQLNYTGTGSGNAILQAEAGTAAALIVHAASLENQFVSDGYSEEPFGRAIFWGDFVLLGPQSDPAGVLTNAPTDAVQAFQDIAAAGAAGKAEFISRGGNPGTTVAEHQIWAATSGVQTCNVDQSPDGGGTAPTTDPAGTSCTPSSQDPPSWYKVTGAKQAANILAADSCNFGSATNDCYVLTDRGTYKSLVESTTPPANLQVVTRNDKASEDTADGLLLVNSFHAYVINPSAVPANSNTDVRGATKLLDYLTSPAAQTAIGQYLNSSNDPPFLPDAAPHTFVSNPANKVTAGKPIKVTGRLTNVVPGTPELSGFNVRLQSVPSTTPNATPQDVTSATTDANGRFTLSYVPSVNASYTFVSDPITQIEKTYPSAPNFADMLQGTSTALGTTNVQGAFSGVRASGTKNHLTVTGNLQPAATGNGANVTLFARPAGSTGAFAYHGRQSIPAGATTFSTTYYLKTGKYEYYVKYNNPGFVATGTSAVKPATVS